MFVVAFVETNRNNTQKHKTHMDRCSQEFVRIQFIKRTLFTNLINYYPKENDPSLFIKLKSVAASPYTFIYCKCTNQANISTLTIVD